MTTNNDQSGDGDVLFGREVRRRRLALGLTLVELSARCGVSTNFIGSVELGKRNPSLTTVLAIAKGLRVPIGELVGDGSALSPGAFETGRLFDQVQPIVQEFVLGVLRLGVKCDPLLKKKR